MKFWCVLRVGLSSLFLVAGPGVAQNIVPDATLGEDSSQILPIGDRDFVLGGLNSDINLFHSFKEFGVQPGRIASFVVPDQKIENIFARITGTKRSEILGAIETFGIFGQTPAVDANLFLINPNGILFGPNSRIEIGTATRGNFVSTTLNGLTWSDGKNFSSEEQHQIEPLLEIVGYPTSFVASQDPVGAIELSGSGLLVDNDQSILLIGGEIEATNSFIFSGITDSGRVELVSLSQPGAVQLSAESNNLTLSIDRNLIRGNIRLLNTSINALGEKGGSISLYGNDIELAGGSALRVGISQNSEFRESRAGSLLVDAQGVLDIQGGSGLLNSVTFGGIGTTEGLTAIAKQILVSDNSVLVTSNFGEGSTGDLILKASKGVFLEDALLRSSVEEGATGNSGNIVIEAPVIYANNDSKINVDLEGKGNASDVIIRTDKSLLFQNSNLSSNVQAGATGQSGNISIYGTDMEFRDGSSIQAANLSQGDAGDIKIEAYGKLSLDNSLILSGVARGGDGLGGDLEINAMEVKITNNSTLDTRSFAKGSSGSIEIHADRYFLLRGSNIRTLIVEDNVAKGRKAGNILISAPKINIDNSGLDSSTVGKGDAGHISIQADEELVLENTSFVISDVGLNGQGQGGNIDVRARDIEILDGSQFSSSSLGIGNAGKSAFVAENLTLQGVDLDGEIFNGDFIRSGILSGVSPDARGNGGVIEIDSDKLEIIEGAALSTATDGIGDAGTILINVRELILLKGTDIVGRSNIIGRGGTGIFNGNGERSTGDGGSLIINTSRLEVLDGAQIVLNGLSSGNAGNVEINSSNSILLSGTEQIGRSSSIFTANGNNAFIGQGKGGNITLITPELTIERGAVIDARTQNSQPGGNVTLNLGQLNLVEGGQILTSSEAEGPAGSIAIKATQGILVSGADPSFSERLASFGVVVAPVSEFSSLSVRSSGVGSTGNIILNTPSLILDDRGQIIAESAAGDGGNIFIGAKPKASQFANLPIITPDTIILKNNSFISATAGDNQNPGNGGNININTPFLISFPKGNSDIIANAFEGTGGNITINSDAILNFQLQDEPNVNALRSNTTNDISASSAFGSSGILNLAGLNVDPAGGAAQLPVAPASPNQVDRTCSAQATNKNSFTVTGRGGIPFSPDDLPSTVSSASQWLALPPEASQSAHSQPTSTKQSSIPNSIKSRSTLTEASGWRMQPSGRVQLIASGTSPVKVLAQCIESAF